MDKKTDEATKPNVEAPQTEDRPVISEENYDRGIDIFKTILLDDLSGRDAIDTIQTLTVATALYGCPSVEDANSMIDAMAKTAKESIANAWHEKEEFRVDMRVEVKVMQQHPAFKLLKALVQKKREPTPSPIEGLVEAIKRAAREQKARRNHPASTPDAGFDEFLADIMKHRGKAGY